jgi:eukaryotic-like serine/threonine-protein kinase
MNTDRWNTVKEIFNKACELSPGDRRAYLKKACGGDTGLETEIRDLLRMDGATSTLLDGIPGYDIDPPDGNPVEPAASERIGPYKILEELGSGGMGVVYLVERADRHYNKRMALKLVKRGMDTDEVLHRFRHERQILASLEHPNIARLYDGGASEDGRPYLVMEYVEGEPITTYCDTRNLSIDERLRLFATVCNSVQFAHQNLIVHRDLKPSNVMVTRTGDVRLLDFGIAKLLQESEVDDRAYTRPWARRVTPQYASPEQLSAGPITTASDVYSLGIILYELITGSHPYKNSAGENTFGLPEVSKRIESPAARIAKSNSDEIFKARRTTKNSLHRRIKKDLESIVMTALHPEPERRYQSAEQLLRDIERHLNGHPVNAHPPATLYRFRKFVGRNRTVSASVLSIFLITVFFSIFTWMQSMEIARERDVAETERDKALELASFMDRVFEAADPFNPDGGTTDTLRVATLLQRGAESARRELGESPETQAQMFRSIGLAYMGLGMYPEATVYLEEALSLRISSPGTNTNDLIESYLDFDKLLYSIGEYGRAEALMRKALAIVEAHPEVHDDQRANVWHSLAVNLAALNQQEDAEEYFRHSLEIRRSLYGDVHQQIAAHLSSFGTLLSDMEKYTEAERMLRESIAIRQELYGSDHPAIAVGFNNLAHHLLKMKKLDEAEAAVREALRINRIALGSEHLYVAQNLNLLGSILRFKGNYSAARDALHESIHLLRTHQEGDHPSLPISLHAYAGLLIQLDSLNEAKTAILEALQIERDREDGRHFGVAVTLERYGEILHRQGDPTEALEAYTESVQIMEKLFHPSHRRLLAVRQSTASVMKDLGQIDDAEQTLRDIYMILQDTAEPDDPLTRSTLRELVDLFEAHGENEQASHYKAMLNQ